VHKTTAHSSLPIAAILERTNKQIVLAGSLIAFFKYPEIGMLFIVSPLACAGVIFFLLKINPADIDHDAARGLKEGSYNLTEADGSAPLPNDSQTSAATPFGKEKPNSPLGNASFNFSSDSMIKHEDGAESPLTLLKDTTLLTFIIIVFLFHMSNGTVLPLVMQTLAIGDGGAGILLAGLCIILAQFYMVGSAKVCGDYSGVWGRKTIFLIGLFSVPVRCLILFILSGIKNAQDEASVFLQIVILSTQILDGVGAGVFGTMYILVTSDISAGTGRFSLTLGMTTAAMSIGGTVSGYLGQALAQDLGYQKAFAILGFMACIPSFSYLFFMPETLNNSNKSRQEMSVIRGN